MPFSAHAYEPSLDGSQHYDIAKRNRNGKPWETDHVSGSWVIPHNWDVERPEWGGNNYGQIATYKTQEGYPFCRIRVNRRSK